MRYDDFLEQSYRALRDAAPPVADYQRLHEWLLAIGEMLALMPLALRESWSDQYGALLVIKYGHINPTVATCAIRHAIDEAAGRWPKPLNNQETR